MSGDRDKRLLERLRSEYAPEPLSCERAADFDRRLGERLARTARRRVSRPVVPLLVAASAVVLLVALWRQPAPERPAETAGAWELELLFASDVEPRTEIPDTIALPADYQAIASLWLDR